MGIGSRCQWDSYKLKAAVFSSDSTDALLAFWVLNICKRPACNAGDLGSVPGLEKSPREGDGNQLQYSCLGNPVDRGAWWITVHGV